MSNQRGFQLVELLFALVLMTMGALIVVPPLFRLTAKERVRLAAGEIAATLRQTRALAIRHNTHVGVKYFVTGDGEPSWAVYRDGDGDGVRTVDILDGTDPVLIFPRRLIHFGRTVGFGIPADLRPRDPGRPSRRLDRLEDPIRFNRSDIASFGPLGRSTPGSIYVTDGHERLAVVRLWARTAKIRVLEYDARTEAWE